jgi:hypothetical protein
LEEIKNIEHKYENNLDILTFPFRLQTIKSTANPKWHQSFIYDIIINELPPLELTVIDDTGGSGEFMGR